MGGGPCLAAPLMLPNDRGVTLGVRGLQWKIGSLLSEEMSE